MKKVEINIKLVVDNNNNKWYDVYRKRGENMNLLKLRTLKGFTQVDVAKKVGCSLTSYQLWEKGVTTPTEENQEKLKQVLGTEGLED